MLHTKRRIVLLEDVTRENNIFFSIYHSSWRLFDRWDRVPRVFGQQKYPYINVTPCTYCYSIRVTWIASSINSLRRLQVIFLEHWEILRVILVEIHLNSIRFSAIEYVFWIWRLISLIHFNINCFFNASIKQRFSSLHRGYEQSSFIKILEHAESRYWPKLILSVISNFFL